MPNTPLVCNVNACQDKQHVAGDWASFATPRPGGAAAAAWDAFTQAETPSKVVQFTPSAPKALRQASPADLEAVDNGESLQLLETWQGSFTGPTLLKAGDHCSEQRDVIQSM